MLSYSVVKEPDSSSKGRLVCQNPSVRVKRNLSVSEPISLGADAVVTKLGMNSTTALPVALALPGWVFRRIPHNLQRTSCIPTEFGHRDRPLGSRERVKPARHRSYSTPAGSTNHSSEKRLILKAAGRYFRSGTAPELPNPSPSSGPAILCSTNSASVLPISLPSSVRGRCSI